MQRAAEAIANTPLSVKGRRLMVHLTIYSRPGCHLCDEMKATVARVARRFPLQVHEMDITTDADLEARYGLEIPVLMVDGKKAAKYRLTEEELLRILRGRTL